MKRLYFLFPILLFSLSGTCQNWKWSNTGVSSAEDMAFTSHSRYGKNLYVTGFIGSGGKLGNYPMGSTLSEDAFIAKYDTTGKVIWAKSFPGSDQDGGRCVVEHLDSSVYLAGVFRGSLQMGMHNFTSLGNGDLFISKLDKNGNVLWALQAGGALGDEVRGMDVDSEGNVYITGWFESNITLGSSKLYSNGRKDLFVARISKNGQFQWAKRAGVLEYGDEQIFAIATDTKSVYLSGIYDGVVHSGDFDNSHALETFGGVDFFLAKVDSAGDVEWVNSYGGTGLDQIYDMTLTDRKIVLAGAFNGSLTAGSHTIISKGLEDNLMLCVNKNGTAEWMKSFGGLGQDIIRKIIYDNEGFLWTTGIFNGISNFGNNHLVSEGGFDVFVAKYDTLGNFKQALRSGSSGEESRPSIVKNSNGLFLTANFDNSVMLDKAVVTKGKGDFFTARTPVDFSIYATARNKSVCSGGSFVLDYKTNFTFNAGNVFSLQISDKNGFFSSQGYLSHLLSRNSGTFEIKLPDSVKSHQNFRLRVTASNPLVNSDIIPIIVWDSITSKPVITGESESFIGRAFYTVSNSTYSDLTWSVPGETIKNVIGDSIEVEWTTPGQKKIFCYSTTTCGRSETAEFNVLVKEDHSLTLSPASLSFCAGSAISIPFTTTGSFNTDNIFSIELSDSGGGFDNALNLGSLHGHASGSISCNVPLSVQEGDGYKLRLTSTSPSLKGAPIEGAVKIAKKPQAPALARKEDLIEATFVTGGSYTWYRNDSIIEGNSNNAHSLKSGKYTVTVTVGGCTSDRSEVLPVLVTGMENFEADFFYVYPNPFLGELTVKTELLRKAEKVEIFNIYGQSVFDHKIKFPASSLTLDLAPLGEGLYILRIISKTTIEKIRIVKLK